MTSISDLFSQAVKAHQAGQLQQAQQGYQAILAHQPNHLQALNAMGLLALQCRQFQHAVQFLQQAVQQNSREAAIQRNLGMAYQGVHQMHSARQCHLTALELDPNDTVALKSLGETLVYLGEYEEAEHRLRAARLVLPEDYEIDVFLAQALICQHEFDLAGPYLERAQRMAPNNHQGRLRLAKAHELKGDSPTAIKHHERVLRDNPENVTAHFDRGFNLLKLGRFLEGWLEYEWRWDLEGAQRPEIPRPLWDGRPLDGQTVLVYDEQGAGDTLQFVRYSRMVTARGGRCLLCCKPALGPLMRLIPELDGVFHPDQTTFPPFKFHAPLMSLPGIVRTTVETIPAEVPYLHADAALVAQWRDRVCRPGARNIGIAWQGNPEYQLDAIRSIPLCEFAPVAQADSVRLISLQQVHGIDQLPSVRQRFSIEVLDEAIDQQAGPFMDTAAIMMNLDLMITSDSALAHLAGGLGVPTWLALPYTSDWRWLMRRDDSPWYPSMRLFRQQRMGDWQPVFQAMADSLQTIPPGQPLAPDLRAGQGC